MKDVIISTGVISWLGKVLDQVSERTGIIAMRDWLWHPSSKDVITLDIPGYKQTNTFSCAVTAGLMVLRTFQPGASVSRFYQLVDPDPELGTEPHKLVSALRRSGLGVKQNENMKWRDVYKTVSDGFPIITTIITRDPDVDHWVVIYGVGSKPNRVFIAGNGLPVLGRREYPWQEFASIWWRPKGFGLVCWG